MSGWKFGAVHIFLSAISAIGALLSWGWFGPVAGIMWSVACFGFGVMFGMAIKKDTK